MHRKQVPFVLTMGPKQRYITDKYMVF